jgi:hypothetical protein
MTLFAEYLLGKNPLFVGIMFTLSIHYCTLGWVDFWRKFDFEWKYLRNIFIFMKKYGK